MRIVEDSPARLVMQDQPGCIWLLGLFFAAIGGVFIVGLLGAFTNLSDVSPAGRVVAWAMALAAVGAGAHIVRGTPRSRLELDRAAQTLTLRRRGLFRNEAFSYPLTLVSQVLVRVDKDSDGDNYYRLVMLLDGGQEVVISHVGQHDRAGLDLVADALRAALGGG